MAPDRAARPSARPRRLFVAAELATGAQAAIDAAIAPWREAFPEARWAPVANRHVTLKFLGPVWPRHMDSVREHVGEGAARVRTFESRLAGLGAFPAPDRARVLWAGLDDRAGRLAELALSLDAALTPEVPPETRAFRPHVTVARSRSPLTLPEAFAATSVEPVVVRVDRIVLFESLGRPVPRYEPVATIELRP